MKWSVEFTAKAAKQLTHLPWRMRERLDLLVYVIKENGPLQQSMPHFGKLKNRPGDVSHCHLNAERPTYVVVWRVKSRTVCQVEVIYAGTHEKAPY